MRSVRLPLLVAFVILDGVGVGAVLLDDALGGGWAADALAVAIVLVCIGVLLAAMARILVVSDPSNDEADGGRRMPS